MKKEKFTDFFFLFTFTIKLKDMNGFKEFWYSMKVFIISLLTNLTLLTLFYYIFNIRQFPPKFGREFWIITSVISLSVTFFVKKNRVMRSGYSSFRKSVIIFSSMFCTFMIMLFSIDLLSLYNTKTKEIANIEEVYTTNSRGLTIRNFDIIISPMIYSGIKSRKKPVSKYAQVVFTYPFQSKNQDIFYCLIFKKQIDRNSDEENRKQQLNELVVYTRDTIMKNYNFQKIKNFEYITKMSPEYRDISEALPEGQKAVLLKPVITPVEEKAKEEIISMIRAILIVFFGYIAIFLLSRVPNWK
ncbi:hypothetical protein [Chryseobacterium cheonjiense]|uniref:Uncharacterized protein n=1 Tax=Chryseobacterium cheonjiense TaxID=2728845 RepID=A0A7Y0A457_9FLAO|nr:hypothetical protein [Chryseobacterium cheonjiense]NML56314.1 hypothetical protein [Chryseobacterium cheonjiense]